MIPDRNLRVFGRLGPRSWIGGCRLTRDLGLSDGERAELAHQPPTSHSPRRAAPQAGTTRTVFEKCPESSTFRPHPPGAGAGKHASLPASGAAAPAGMQQLPDSLVFGA